MSTVQDSVTVRVPATTANVGPGFDTLGIALDLHNAVTVSLGGDDGVTHLENQEDNPAAGALAQGAADAFFTRSGCASRGVRVSVQGAVPVSCGLGSSVTIRLGIVFNTTPQFWMNLQARYDLEVAEPQVDTGTIDPLVA